MQQRKSDLVFISSTINFFLSPSQLGPYRYLFPPCRNSNISTENHQYQGESQRRALLKKH
jgi:hypothetical protein